MKRLSTLFSILLFLLVLSGQSYAQIDNLTNMSAEWIRMSNRNAATDATDIVVYNPAGVVSLSDGFHINISNQFMFRNPEHSFTDPLTGNRETFEQDGPDLFVPNFYAAYKKDKWAVFGGVYLPGSAATIDYPDGSITTREIGIALLTDPASPFLGAYSGLADEHLKASSLYLAVTMGGAYQITDKVSLAAAVRNLSVKNNIKGGLTLTGGVDPAEQKIKVDVDQEDSGWGGVLGFQVKPDDKLVLAFRYETRVNLDLETDIKSGDTLHEQFPLFTDGEKNRRDFPAMVGMGASYQFNHQFRGEFDANYWFQRDAHWGKAADGRDISHMAGDCWSIGVAGAYQATPKLELSAGTLYTEFAWNDLTGYYNANLGSIETGFSDNINLGVGLGYKIIPALKLNLGASYTWWKGVDVDTPIGVNVNMHNSTYIFAVGLDYSL